MDIEALAFDLDGTLYPSRKMYFHSIPFFLRHPVLVTHFGRVRRAIRTIRPIYNFRELQANLLAFSMRIAPEKAAELIERDIYGEWEDSFRRVAPFPDLRQVLESLKDDGLRLACFSDFPVERKLRFLKLEGLWSAAFSSEETGYLKPNPEPFNHLAERLRLPPERIMYVGNNYRYDVVGAADAGMKTAHLSRAKIPGSRADLTFSSFGELRQYLRARVEHS